MESSSTVVSNPDGAAHVADYSSDCEDAIYLSFFNASNSSLTLELVLRSSMLNPVVALLRSMLNTYSL